MKDERIEVLDPVSRLAVTLVDCTTAAVELARTHLSGPTAARFLSEALAGVALLGVETSCTDETVTFRLDCPGPLEGFLVEVTDKGTLRGYTKKKILNDLDGTTHVTAAKALGTTGTVEVIRSIPGKILSSGTVAIANPTVASALEAYFVQSLQRRVCVAVTSEVGEDCAPVIARGIMIECLPDGDVASFTERASRCMQALRSPLASARTILKKLLLPRAEIRKTTPLAFACRCSSARALAALATLTAEERAHLPSTLDVTCHLCGRTWSVPTQSI